MGVPFRERWILAWAYEGGDARWALTGFASAYPRQRLGEVSRWWDLRRRSDHFEGYGLYGREALARALAGNDSVEGFTMSSAEPTTAQLAGVFTRDALARAGAAALPREARAAADLLSSHLTASYREGSWQFVETPYLSFPMLAQVRQGWCEANIVFMSLLRTAGVKARYVHDDTRITKTEVWTGRRFEVGTFDDGNRTIPQNRAWTWLGASMKELAAAGSHTNPNVVVYFCDPHAYCAMRRLYLGPLTTQLFERPHGLSCFDWGPTGGYPWSDVGFRWAD
jgi:hypothetical protein